MKRAHDLAIHDEHGLVTTQHALSLIAGMLRIIN